VAPFGSTARQATADFDLCSLKPFHTRRGVESII
jgi:hypothetical protein